MTTDTYNMHCIYIYKYQEWNNPLQVLDTQHTPALAAEVKSLLVGSVKEAIKSERLFQIYTQKEEMNMLVHDFRETEAFFGPADTTDMYNWSQFLIENSADLEKYTKDVKESEAMALQKANEAAGILPVMKLKQRKLLLIKGDEGKFNVTTVTLETVRYLHSAHLFKEGV